MTADLTPLKSWTLVFDLDGTLVDSAPDLVATLNVLLGDEGVDALPLAAARTMIGKGARALIQRGFSAAGVPLERAKLDEMFERFIAHYQAHIADESVVFPGVEAALDSLSAAGATLAVCTNKRTDLAFALLKALDLSDRFAAIVGGDMAAAPKPDAGHLLTAIEAAGGHADKALMIGDSASDSGAARAAGVPCILVSFGYTETPARDLGAEVVIDSFDELPAACARLAACSREAETL